MLYQLSHVRRRTQISRPGPEAPGSISPEMGRAECRGCVDGTRRDTALRPQWCRRGRSGCPECWGSPSRPEQTPSVSRTVSTWPNTPGVPRPSRSAPGTCRAAPRSLSPPCERCPTGAGPELPRRRRPGRSTPGGSASTGSARRPALRCSSAGPAHPSPAVGGANRRQDARPPTAHHRRCRTGSAPPRSAATGLLGG
jgi:hypothetical protein